HTSQAPYLRAVLLFWGKSRQGTQFRQWATKRIHEYIVKGFTMDDDRLKQEGARSRYFEELLQRIRDIRRSERNFYQKVTDIYATSIDYRNDVKLTKKKFATIQNKRQLKKQKVNMKNTEKQKMKNIYLILTVK
ncbi:MAG: virulence RhuM family protein, partial [Bacteroidales bacterium]|nr:virulence RhuM family protein [Bacteroidales bacterium]